MFKQSINPIGMLFVFITAFWGCRQDAAAHKLDNMEAIISRWELTLQERPADFNDLVMIQKEITMYDLDPVHFSASYRGISAKQTEKVKQLRSRFRKLLNGISIQKINE